MTGEPSNQSRPRFKPMTLALAGVAVLAAGMSLLPPSPAVESVRDRRHSASSPQRGSASGRPSASGPGAGRQGPRHLHPVWHDSAPARGLLQRSTSYSVGPSCGAPNRPEDRAAALAASCSFSSHQLRSAGWSRLPLRVFARRAHGLLRGRDSVLSRHAGRRSGLHRRAVRRARGPEPGVLPGRARGARDRCQSEWRETW